MARNAGLDFAHGDYIAFVDSDDFVDLHLLEITSNVIKENDADMCMFLFHYFDSSLENLCVPIVNCNLENTFEKLTIEHANLQTAWCNLYRRDFLVINNLRFCPGILFEDVPFVTKAAIFANRISIVPQRLYFYRLRDDSITGNSTGRNYLQRIDSLNILLKDLLNCNLSEDVVQWCVSKKWEIIYSTYQRMNLKLKKEFIPMVKAGMLPYELYILHNNIQLTKPNISCFFRMIAGNYKEKYYARLKYLKYSLSDWLVKKLIPHSSFLQLLLDTNKEQRDTIQLLQEKLRKQL